MGNQNLLVLIGLLFSLSISFLKTGVAITFAPCDSTQQWTAYKNEKCFKIIDALVTLQEALELCRQEIGVDNVSPLMTIKSEEEQEFLNNFLFQDTNILDNVWLSARRRNEDPTEFEWLDGIKVDYTNWADGSPSEDLEKACTQITPQMDNNETTIGLWSDVSCLRRNVVICERSQEWSANEAHNAILRMMKEVNEKSIEINQLEIDHQEFDVGVANLDGKMQEQISKQDQLEATQLYLNNNPVPIGFIYTQYPNQPLPNVTWPTVVWEDVTKDYAGLFFRAEGEESEAFGENQEMSSPALKQIDSQYFEEADDGDTEIEIPIEGWSRLIRSGATGEKYNVAINFYVTNGEVRPKNMAIRLFKRIA